MCSVEPQPVPVWISLGSNIPGAAGAIDRAEEILRGVLTDCRFSGSYTSPAVNGVDPDYTNAVATGLTTLGAEALSAECKRIETFLGRSRRKGESQFHLVEIDLDVVVYGGEVLRPRDFSRSYFTIGAEALGYR